MFEWADGRVVKVLRPAFPENLADEEARVATLVEAVLGDEAPRFFGQAPIGGRPGLIYERVYGSTMLDSLTGKPWLVRRYARDFAALHVRIHEARGAGLPALADGWRSAIERATDILGTTRRARILERLASLPRGDRICHGDMHPGNVLMSAGGPKVIDWMSAKVGPPEADVARTLFLLEGSEVPKSYPRLQRLMIGAVRRQFANGYLKSYRALRPIGEQALRSWRLPVLGARLAEGIHEERDAVLRQIDRELG